MARKKGRDLFEVLGARASGGRTAPKPAPKQESGVSMALADLGKWMDAKGYGTLADARGKLSSKEIANPFAYERAQYVKLLTG